MKNFYGFILLVIFLGTAKAQTTVITMDLPEECRSTALQTISSVAGKNFVIYPNPSDGNFTIEAKIAGKTGNVHILLSDFSGKLIFKKQVRTKNNGLKEEFRINNLNDGVYFLTLETDSEKISKKIIIKK